MDLLTREQKIKIYRHAAEIITVARDRGVCFGLQEALVEAGYSYEEAVLMSRYRMGKYFPEIYKLKPAGYFPGNWWPIQNRTIRIEALLNAANDLMSYKDLTNP